MPFPTIFTYTYILAPKSQAFSHSGKTRHILAAPARIYNLSPSLSLSTVLPGHLGPRHIFTVHITMRAHQPMGL